MTGKNYTFMDRTIQLIGLIALGLLVGLPAFHYGALPQTIPIQFGSDGTPQVFGHKGLIWVLPVVGLLVYGLFSWLTMRPKWLNYSADISPDRIRRMLNALKTVIAFTFAYLIYATLQTALGRQEGLNPYFMFSLLCLMLVLALSPLLLRRLLR